MFITDMVEKQTASKPAHHMHAGVIEQDVVAAEQEQALHRHDRVRPHRGKRRLRRVGRQKANRITAARMKAVGERDLGATTPSCSRMPYQDEPRSRHRCRRAPRREWCLRKRHVNSIGNPAQAIGRPKLPNWGDRMTGHAADDSLQNVETGGAKTQDALPDCIGTLCCRR